MKRYVNVCAFVHARVFVCVCVCDIAVSLNLPAFGSAFMTAG